MQPLSDITEFSGQYRWLSNFFPCAVRYDNMVFPSVENAYQAAKESRIDLRYKYQICSPSTAKKWGRKVKLRPLWDDVEKLIIMEGLLRQKFEFPGFDELLIATDNVRISEGNHHGDTYWGVCDGVGEDHLGRLIMKIRGDLCRTI